MRSAKSELYIAMASAILGLLYKCAVDEFYVNKLNKALERFEKESCK